MDIYTEKMLNRLKEATKIPLKFSLTKAYKISSKPKRAFSLPAGRKFSCPGATKTCQAQCYAQKGRHIFDECQLSYLRNWLYMNTFRIRKDIKGCAAALLKIIPPSATIFRIHELGDFEDQFAVNVWTKIAEMRPQTKFFAITRSFHLNYSKLLEASVSLVLSVDKDNYREAKKTSLQGKERPLKLGYGPWQKGDPLPRGAKGCPATGHGPLHGVEGACERCGRCYREGGSDIVFYKH